MKEIVENYVNNLEAAYRNNGGAKEWEHFVTIKEGASEDDVNALRAEYPEIPESLIELLKYVDGTYFRKYKEETVTFYFLGSDLEEYPYYLLSSKKILENKGKAKEYYEDYVDRAYEEDEVKVDDRIISNSEEMKWLHFSDCMNNGGTSQLFIDFSPSKTGKVGQIVMYVHDPDELTVIADSFDEYLENMVFDFICPYLFED